MKMKQRMHFIITGILAMVLIFNVSAYAETSTTDSESDAVKMTFTDTIGHWSSKYVAKIAAMGVVNGYPNGSFGVEDNVSQQDVILMAIRLMGLEDEAKETYDNFYTPLQSEDYAQAAVELATEKGLLNSQEEALNNANVHWGKKSATKEWVAKIIIRAIGKEAEANAAANVPTTFIDNNDISSSALGFVNTAVKLGIVTGNPNNTFLPLSTISRAEVATMYARATQYLSEQDSILSGYVSSIDKNYMVVKEDSGKATTLIINTNTSFFTFKNNFQILSSDIKEGNQVEVVASKDAAVYVELTSDEVPTEKVTGVFITKDIANTTVTIQTDSGENTYLFSSNVQVIDKNGNGSGLADLLPNSKIEFRKSTVSQMIVRIDVIEEPVNKTSSGIITAITADGLTVSNTTSNLSETYPLAGEVEITSNQVKIERSALSVNDEIKYTVTNGTISAIDVTAPYFESATGTVVSVDPNKKIITIATMLSETGFSTYPLAANVKVVLDGIAAPTLGDVHPDDAIILDFDSNHKVKQIRITNRSISSLQMLKFESYIADNNTVVIIDGKTTRVLMTTEDTVVEYMGLPYDRTHLSEYITKGRLVDLVLSGEYIVKIKLSDHYIGKVKEINTTTGVMKIESDTTGMTTLNVPKYTPVLARDAVNASIQNIRIGDDVKVILSADQTSVSQIQIKTNLRYTVSAVNASTGSVTVKDDANHSISLTPGLSVKLTHPTKDHVTIADVAEKSTVTISYYGYTMESLNLVSLVYGEISSIGAATMTVKTLDNQVIQYDTANKFVKSGTLKQQDRVEIIQDIDGYTFVTVLPKLSKTFYKLESGNQISFINPLNELEKYTMDENVIVRSGTQSISLSSLKKDDKLNIYSINNTIIEIEKIN